MHIVSIPYLHLELYSNRVPILINGDFNLHNVRWSSLIGNNPISSLFSDLFFESNLTQIVDSPTHLKGNILDVVLSNACDVIEDVNTQPHNLVSFSISGVLLEHTTSKSNYLRCVTRTYNKQTKPSQV